MKVYMSILYPRNKGIPARAWSYHDQRGFVQKPVTSQPTPYEVVGWRSSWSGPRAWERWGITPLAFNLGPGTGSMDLAYSRAYDNFIRSIRGGQAAALGITLVQWRQSLDMVSTRTRQIASAANDVRKGNIVRALKTMNIVKVTRKQKTRFRRLHQKDPAKLWLELQFGWLPLYSDIKSAADALARDIPTERKYGTSRSTFDYYYTLTSEKGRYTTLDEGMGVSRWRLGATVVSVDPNLYLAANMGLTNPLLVAWDAVPFSFVIDWFVPINKYLSSFDSLVGFELKDAFSTHSVKAMSTEKMTYWGMYPWVEMKTSHSYRVKRAAGVGPRPTLASRIPPVSGSLWRAVTGVALAVTSLSKLRLNFI